MTPAQKFASAARSVLRKVEAYVRDSDVLTANKAELALYAARNRLEDKGRDLIRNDECTPDELSASALLMTEVVKAIQAAPERARAVRTAGYEAEIKRLKDWKREADSKLCTYEREVRAGLASRSLVPDAYKGR